jgi:hypothetical protein
MATTANRPPKTADELAATLRGHAEASIKDAQDLAAATVDHSREVTSALRRSALDTATRSTDVAVEAWKAWSAAASGTVPRANVAEVLDASFDMAGGVLDAQRQLARRLVGAGAAAAR